VTNQGPTPTRRVRMREWLAVVIAAVIILLGLPFGRKGDGPDWLLGVLLVLVAVISIVATDGRRSPRERVVLGLVVVAGLELLLSACWLMMTGHVLSREQGVRGEVSRRSCRPVPGGYGAFVITV
jgi:uncharacterized membrane protein